MTQGDPLPPVPIVIHAVSCDRVNATRIRLVLAQPLTAPIGDCALHYLFGGDYIGRGNAITDNAATLHSARGWDIGGQLGPAWAIDYPLGATFTPIPLSAVPF